MFKIYDEPACDSVSMEFVLVVRVSIVFNWVIAK